MAWVYVIRVQDLQYLRHHVDARASGGRSECVLRAFPHRV